MKPIKEFDLLILLIRHKGKVLNRVYIMESILGKEFFGNYRVIDAHIKNLRKNGKIFEKTVTF